MTTDVWPPDPPDLLEPELSDDKADAEVDLTILLESDDFPPLLESDSCFPPDLCSLDGRWKAFDSDFPFSFSFDDLSEDSVFTEELDFAESPLVDEDLDESELFDEALLGCSVLLELDFEVSDFWELDPDFETSDFDPEGLVVSTFCEPAFDCPDKLAARLASPLRGFADPEFEDSFDEDVLWKVWEHIWHTDIFTAYSPQQP